jgi:hypothetical protein
VGQLGTAPVSRLDFPASVGVVLVSFWFLHPRFWFLVVVVSVTAAASRRQKPKRKQYETKQTNCCNDQHETKMKPKRLKIQPGSRSGLPKGSVDAYYKSCCTDAKAPLRAVL